MDTLLIYGIYMANLLPMRSLADLSEINGEGLESPPLELSFVSPIGVDIIFEVIAVPPILIILGFVDMAFLAASFVFRVSTDPVKRILLRLTLMAELLSPPPDLGEASITLLLIYVVFLL